MSGEICGISPSNLLRDHHLWIKTENIVHLELHSASDLSVFWVFFKVMMSHKETPKEAPPPNGFCLMLFHDSINVNPTCSQLVHCHVQQRSIPFQVLIEFFLLGEKHVQLHVFIAPARVFPGFTSSQQLPFSVATTPWL